MLKPIFDGVCNLQRYFSEIKFLNTPFESEAS
jgi:hypothetical protein